MFTNQTIKTRLISLVGFLSVLLIVVGGLGLWGMHSSNDGLQSVYVDRTVPLGDINMIIRKNNLNRTAIADALLEFKAENIREQTATVEKNRDDITKLWEGYMATTLTPEEAVLAKEFAEARGKFVKEALMPAVAALRAGNRDEALRLFHGPMEELFKDVRQHGNDLAQLQLDVAKQEFEHAQSRFNTIFTLSIIAILIGAAFGIFVATMLIRSLSQSLAQAGDVAGRIASGDLSSQITVTSQDEVGALLKSMQSMQSSLTGLVREIQDIVGASVQGDFSKRVDLSNKQGFGRTIGESLNQLAETTDAGLKDIQRVTSALAAGDLNQKITKTYPGVFGQTAAGVNGTVESLDKTVAEIQAVVQAASAGDFSQRMSQTGKQGYTEVLTKLLNQLSDTTEVGLRDIQRVAEALSKGDLTQTIDKNYPGLFGETKDGVNATVTNLKELVGQIKESVDAIGTASREIATGNADLSSRTESQASSLEETASSMDELTSTVKNNAENAKQANQLAQGASTVAIKGGEMVGEVVHTMSAISESSSKIADIISVIDGIAFQTNILALNAAVEAARAGEQGRGFAVVAGEVRTLAQRSAAAAKEIKQLINDSVDKVDAGYKVVEQAGNTMQEIVQSVKRVTDIISEIAAASTEQSQGIEQVNAAVVQMDEMTQQNAALVEEAAAAAESLQDQADGLSRAVSVFKTGSGTGMVATAPRRAMARAAAPAAKPVARAKPAQAAGGDEWQEF